MFNFLYESYPYGTVEPFVEYEMQALADSNREFNVYLLRKADTSKKRFLPPKAKVFFIQKSSFKVLFLAFLKMFNKSSITEIINVLRKKQKEGFLRCVYRIYSYRVTAEGFRIQYEKNIKEDVFASYWINECAFALTELKRKYPNIKVSSRGHGYDVFEERGYMPFRKQILSGLDKIFLINKASKAYFENRYGDWLDTSKIEVAHLGVYLPEVTNKLDNEDVFRIVTCSWVIPLKRLDIMIDALSTIKDKKIEWVHIGGGPLFNEIKNYAQEKLSESSVSCVFKGQLELKDIHNYYSSTPVHLFVNCSDTEGTPVSIMEAMSYGIPSVARNVGGVGELVDDTCGKLLPEEENANLLSETIQSFYNLDKEKYFEMRRKSRDKIEKEFNASVAYMDYIDDIFNL